MLTRLLFLIAASFIASTAMAAPIVWNLSGTVTSETGGPGTDGLRAQGITIGIPIQLTITLPDSSVDYCPEDGEAFYSGGAVSTTVLGATYTGGSVAGIEANSWSVGCFAPASNTSTSYVMRMLSHAPVGQITLEWGATTDPDVYPFPLPASVALGLHYVCATCPPDMRGTMVTVPEPTALSLLVFGAPVLIRRRFWWRATGFAGWRHLRASRLSGVAVTE